MTSTLETISTLTTTTRHRDLPPPVAGRFPSFIGACRRLQGTCRSLFALQREGAAVRGQRAETVWTVSLEAARDLIQVVERFRMRIATHHVTHETCICALLTNRVVAGWIPSRPYARRRDARGHSDDRQGTDVTRRRSIASRPAGGRRQRVALSQGKTGIAAHGHGVEAGARVALADLVLSERGVQPARGRRRQRPSPQRGEPRRTPRLGSEDGSGDRSAALPAARKPAARKPTPRATARATPAACSPDYLPSPRSTPPLTPLRRLPSGGCDDRGTSPPD